MGRLAANLSIFIWQPEVKNFMRHSSLSKVTGGVLASPGAPFQALRSARCAALNFRLPGTLTRGHAALPLHAARALFQIPWGCSRFTIYATAGWFDRQHSATVSRQRQFSRCGSRE